MKISVVTISYNQAEFLERTIVSVLRQSWRDFEYIIVDPGSTDGSRDIIERFKDSFAAISFEKDRGPADGLNKGFERATGDIFFYLNSDDTVLPDAFAQVVAAFQADPEVDVFCGHALVTDRNDRVLRRAWSDRFSLTAAAYGHCVVIQPATYIRAEAFRKSNGFNVQNRSTWDGELLIDLGKSGAKIRVLNAFLATYRLHAASITTVGVSQEQLAARRNASFRKVFGREMSGSSKLMSQLFRVRRKLWNIPDTLERLRRGPVAQRDLEP
jgi:glycosyltransferase involved in cell wall biosynthesis